MRGQTKRAASRWVSCLLVGCCFVSLAVADAQAEKWPHARRGTLRTGFGLGRGLGRADVDNAALNTTTDYEGGWAGSLRFAYGLDDDLTMGLEVNGWVRQFEDTAGDSKTWTFSLAAAEATWFPGAGGFFVRGGLGLGTVRAEVTLASETSSIDQGGLGTTLGIGYEWRVGQNLAFGTALDGGHLDVGDGVKADYLNLGLTLDWYL